MTNYLFKKERQATNKAFTRWQKARKSPMPFIPQFISGEPLVRLDLTEQISANEKVFRDSFSKAQAAWDDCNKKHGLK